MSGNESKQVPCISLLDRSELIAILEENLAVTDEWGGCKLASWQWGGNVVVDGIDAAADAILARLSNNSITGGEAVPSNGVVGGFVPCCGQPPKVTEWRPGCYGAQCMECGVIVGDERQLDKAELIEEWNRAMRKRTANAEGESRAASASTLHPLVGNSGSGEA